MGGGEDAATTAAKELMIRRLTIFVIMFARDNDNAEFKNGSLWIQLRKIYDEEMKMMERESWGRGNLANMASISAALCQDHVLNKIAKLADIWWSKM
jgi:hypothetical protein